MPEDFITSNEAAGRLQRAQAADDLRPAGSVGVSPGGGLVKEPHEYPVILRVLVGSRAHGLHREDSDYDYREVFIIPTRELVLERVTRPHIKKGWAVVDKYGDDEGGHEVGDFLRMCLAGHPNALELLVAPVAAAQYDGLELRKLLPALLSAPAVRKAYLGYADNAFRKARNGEGRNKLRTYLRSLYVGQHLLETGELLCDMTKEPGELIDALRRADEGGMNVAEALIRGEPWEIAIREGSSVLPDKPDIERIEHYLRTLRSAQW